MTQLGQRVYKLNTSNPGAGIGDVAAQEGFGTVMKDGFYEVACIRDYMYHHGDAAGANKHEYEIGTRANVSIVHYKDLVPSEDQEPMSSKVCFDFCRTVPDMLFFGVTAGRECYCQPFFQQMAGDSSKCDAVCEGEPTTFCGGMAKSSIFEMHFCDDTAEDLEAAAGKAEEILSKLKDDGGKVVEISKTFTEDAQKAQDTYGSGGDTVASDLMQEAKVVAGDTQHAGEDAVKLGEQLEELKKKAEGLTGESFTDPAKAKEAEETISKIDELVSEGEASIDKVDAIIEKYGSTEKPEGEPLKQYYPIMYFVDDAFNTVPSTCGGDLIKPFAGSAEDCAANCASLGMECKGFFYAGLFEGCFLFSKIKSVTYYTECKSEFVQVEKATSFLQQANVTAHALVKKDSEGHVQPDREEIDTEEPMCWVKFAEFTGMTLKPDPSGKCKQCLKTADKAQRCYK